MTTTDVLGSLANNDLVGYFAGHTINPNDKVILDVCYYESLSGGNGTIWQNADPWAITMPFTSNLGIVILLVRLIYVVLNFAGQPRFLAELMAGLLLASGIYGPHELYTLHLRPLESIPLIATFANWGTLFYAFMVALEMDFSKPKILDKKTLSFTAAGIIVPLLSGAGLHFLFTAYTTSDKDGVLSPWFWAITLTVTSFSDLARILSDLKLLYTDIGRIALASAFLNDLVVWALFAVTIVCLYARTNAPFYLPAIAFTLFCWFAVRPLLAQALTRFLHEQGHYNDAQVYIILSGMFVFGFISDACGCHSIIGVFMFGLILPKDGDLAQRVSNKLERMTTTILLPTFFILIGVRANVSYLKEVNIGLAVAIVLLAVLPKILSSLFVSMCYGMPIREGIALGSLMNTKGITALIILNVARGREILGSSTFTVIVLSLVGMMLLVKPIPHWALKSTRRSKHYKHRTLEKSRPKSPFRVVMCVHATENLPGMINLLQFSRQKKQQPVSVFAVNLVELTRRTTAMLILHETPTSNLEKRPSYHEAETVNRIASSIRNYEKRAQALSVRAMTVVSPYGSMHKDIQNLAVDNRASLVLIPFHKQNGDDECMETENHSIRLVNQNLLATAPCSVGIFLDRGFSLVVRQVDSGRRAQKIRIVVLFAGGSDNREALGFASKMVGAEDVSLTVVRFLPGSDATAETPSRECTIEQQTIDDEYFNEFRFRTMCEESVTCIEKAVNTGYEILASLGDEFNDYDLYILGKGKGVIPAFTSGLSEWTECEELGALGDALSTSDFVSHASILVIQQQTE